MWATGGDLRFAINISAAVLIITCPCALGLAVPAVVTAASGKLFRKGAAHQARHGAGAAGRGGYGGVRQDRHADAWDCRSRWIWRRSSRRSWRLRWRLARGSSHPLARGPGGGVRLWSRCGWTTLREVPGYGVEGASGWPACQAGPRGLVGAEPLWRDRDLSGRAGRSTRAFAFADQLRPGAELAVAALRAQGKRVHAAVGRCRGRRSRTLAERLGIVDWTAGALPAREGRAGCRHGWPRARGC